MITVIIQNIVLAFKEVFIFIAYLEAFHTYGDRLVDKWEGSLLGHNEVKVSVTHDLKKLVCSISLLPTYITKHNLLCITLINYDGLGHIVPPLIFTSNFAHW